MEDAIREHRTIVIPDDDEVQEPCKEQQNVKSNPTQSRLFKGTPKTHSTVVSTILPEGSTGTTEAIFSSISQPAAPKTSSTVPPSDIDTHTNTANGSGVLSNVVPECYTPRPSSAVPSDVTQNLHKNNNNASHSKVQENIESNISEDDFDFLGGLDDGYLLKLFEEEEEEDNTFVNSEDTAAAQANDVGVRNATLPLPVPDLVTEDTTSVRRNPARAAKTNVTYNEEEEDDTEEYCKLFANLLLHWVSI